jgi:Ca2+/H+ antiporter
LLFFVSVCLFLVTLMRMGNLFDAGNFASELKLSRFISVLMLAGYGLYLWFQLKTHVHLFNDDEESGDSGIATQDELNQPLSSGAMDSTMEQGDNFDVRSDFHSFSSSSHFHTFVNF